ncbi:hypothetical protein OWV82_015471 [Melia azedarach]|uniref:Uncharacterized protein n=1 Tax=Melia azedarach TaxID=155640 RepID=A0ACC1XPM1_MELAZ|nr:hypothetical protein OWV82_015471 [Melia azedarach]
MTSSHPEIDPCVYESTKPEIPTNYDVQSSECTLAGKQENIATDHIDHEENQQKQGETKPDYQQAQSQTTSEAKDNQRRATVELPVPPLRVNNSEPFKKSSMCFFEGPKRMEAYFQNIPMNFNGPSQQTIQSTPLSAPSASANSNGPGQQTIQSRGVSVPSVSANSNGPSQQTIQSTPVSAPSASANSKKRKTSSLWVAPFKKCFG